ncbi:hypothetical protein E2C01_038400 [Portunus trituberculatus]|uniref:Uncharacterized protein n=1 Tax=Portunus trituberculatus TaxID=210409 RepID=A0A5B7FE30_PORTR|nr:hypothetical protein [Portunus trituberculatus]
MVLNLSLTSSHTRTSEPLISADARRQVDKAGSECSGSRLPPRPPPDSGTLNVLATSVRIPGGEMSAAGVPRRGRRRVAPAAAGSA